MVLPNAELARSRYREFPVSPRSFGQVGSPADAGFDQETVEKALWSSLPFSKRGDISTSNRDATIAAYRASHAKLTRAAVEIDRLFSAVARASIEIRDCVPASADKRRGEYRKKLVESRESFSFEHVIEAPLTPNSVLHDPLELVELRIEKRLRAEISRLVDALAEKLAELKAENVLGEITWSEEHCCRFDYFGQVIIRNAPAISARTETAVSRRGFMEITTEEKLTVARQTITFRAVHHEHRLENAEAKCVADYSLPLPDGIATVVSAIPSWLEPAMRIVVGDCVHERIIEQDIGEYIEEEIIQRESVQTERYIDPAIVIGRYVIIGWGEREILAAEVSNARAGALADKNSGMSDLSSVTNLHRNAGFGAILAGFIIFVAWFSASTILPTVGIGLAVGGILLLSYSSYLRSEAALLAIGFREMVTFGAQISCAVGAVFAVAAAIRLGSALPLSFLVMFAIAFVSARRFAHE